jgi:hypothetical protein
MAVRNFTYPGTYREEIDLSNILVPVGTSNGGIVIRSRKGPVNRPVLVSNDKEFIDTFGEPIFTSGSGSTTENAKLTPEYGYGAYAAIEFLKESSNLYVVRDFTAGTDNYAGATYGTDMTFTLLSAGVSGTRWAAGERLDRTDYISIIETYGNTGGDGASNFTVAYVGPGIDGNSVGVTVEPFSLSADWKFAYDNYPSSANAASAATLTDNEIDTWYPIASKVFKMNVYVKPTTQEWKDLYRNSTDRDNGRLYIAPVETFYGSFSESLKDNNNNNLFIEGVVNGNSDYIYVKKGASFAPTGNHFPYVNSTSELSALPDAEDTNNQSYVKWQTSATTNPGLVTLSGGSNSITTGLTDTAGWNMLEDRENTTVNILIGTSYSTAQKQEIARVASSRADCICVLQTGELDDDSTSEVIASEEYGYRSPSYAALYCGYSKIYDSYNDKFVWVPNSMFGAAIMARTDNIANPWDAPAGSNRAVLSVLDQRKIWSRDEIGKLYDKNINAVKFERGIGYVIFGQKTAQLKKSALDRINVRRNLLFIENNVETALVPFLFENNTSKTRLRVFSIIDEFISGVIAQGGLTQANVICDQTNNPSSVIDANQLNVAIYVSPARSIEYILQTTVILRTGVSIEETAV